MAEDKTGTNEEDVRTFMGLPMRWERSPRKAVRGTLRNTWNPDDDRVFLPKVWGIGWDVNFHAVLRRMGMAQNAAMGKREKEE
jgi:hypothetical protein